MHLTFSSQESKENTKSDVKLHYICGHNDQTIWLIALIRRHFLCKM